MYAAPSPVGARARGSILYALCPVTDRTDPYEIIGVRRDASLAEIRISYRRSTQILAPERFANANDTVRAEAARRLNALNGAMEAIEAERAAESGSALGSLTFGGPAVSPAVEPSLRSIAVADEPPPPAPAAPAAGARTPTASPACPTSRARRSPEPEEATAPVELAPLRARPRARPSRSRTSARADTRDDLLPVVTPGEDTSDIPLADLEPAPAPVAAPPPRRWRRRSASSAPRARPSASASARSCPASSPPRPSSWRSRPSAPTSCSAAAAASRRAGSSRAPAPRSASRTRASLVARRPPSGGLLKPTFSTAVGVDAANYVVVATYHISANVQADGSAIGTGGSRLTADRFDQSVDRAAERIAAAQKLTAKGPVQPGKAGDLIARIYDYTRPGGSSARYAFAFRGHTEYSIACFWDPAHAQALSAACTQVMTTLQREAA